MDRISVAVAQVSSVFADKDACIAKAVQVISEAGKQGADLVVLPEALIPGYPRGFTYGAIGGLICWENYMPLARMAMYAKGVSIYVAPTADARDSWGATLRHIACEGRCFVLGCNQYFSKSMYPPDLALYDELADLPEELCRGGSAIIDPFGEYVCQPLYGAEGVLYAELDLNKIHQGHLDFDVVGHYNRPDVFKFSVNEAPNPAMTVDNATIASNSSFTTEDTDDTE